MVNTISLFWGAIWSAVSCSRWFWTGMFVADGAIFGSFEFFLLCLFGFSRA